MNHPSLYLLRHGETVWNTEFRLQGNCDSPLTPRGQRQAEAMGRTLHRALADDGLDADAIDLFASPLGRTIETASIVGRVLGVPDTRWRTDARLAELRYGEWEGCVWHDIVKLAPDDIARWRADPHAFTPPAGESHAELNARTRSFLDEALAGPRPRVIVGHGVAGATLRGLYLGLTPAEIFVLEKPQDAIFRLRDRVSTKIAAQMPAA